MQEGKRDYNCIICNKSFMSKNSQTRHKMIHSGEKKFECFLCHKMFRHKAERNQHLLIHTGEKPYKCKICGKCFSHNGNMKQHELAHSTEKPHKCPVCSSSFTRRRALIIHQRIHANLPLISCPHCSRKFRQRACLQYHLNTHKSPVYAFDCIFCNKAFTTYAGYCRHLKAHVGEARVSCELCDREFSDNGHKNEHIRRHHTLEKPHECKICNTRFTTQQEVKMHSITHLSADVPKPHSCIFCDKSFHRHDDLFYHINSHIKEKSYSCKACDHETISSGNMLKHIKRVHML